MRFQSAIRIETEGLGGLVLAHHMRITGGGTLESFEAGTVTSRLFPWISKPFEPPRPERCGHSRSEVDVTEGGVVGVQACCISALIVWRSSSIRQVALALPMLSEIDRIVH